MTAGDISSNTRLISEVTWILNSHDQFRRRQAAEAAKVSSGEAPGRTNLEVHPSDWQERGSTDFICCSSELLVDDADLPRAMDALSSEDLTARVIDSLFGGVTLLAVEGARTEQILARLDARLGVGVVTPNHLLCVTPTVGWCPATEPDAPGRAEPWPGPGDGDAGTGVRVAVIDTGFLQGWEHRSDLPWLTGIGEYDVDDPDRFEPKNFIDPYAGHGTFVAGVVRCMAPACEITVDGALKLAGVVDEATLVKQMGDALSRSPDVINLSAGCYTRKNLPPKAFTALWEYRLRHHKGVALVAAAGNDRGRQPFWPAAYPWAVSVGALTADGRERAEFSNHGGWVDVYAPGVDIVNAYCEGEYRLLLEPDVVRTFKGMCKWSGTSFSTPIVTGLIAARMSRTGENARQAADALLEAARGQFLPGVGPRLLP